MPLHRKKRRSRKRKKSNGAQANNKEETEENGEPKREAVSTDKETLNNASENEGKEKEEQQEEVIRKKEGHRKESRDSDSFKEDKDGTGQEKSEGRDRSSTALVKPYKLPFPLTSDASSAFSLTSAISYLLSSSLFPSGHTINVLARNTRSSTPASPPSQVHSPPTHLPHLSNRYYQHETQSERLSFGVSLTHTALQNG